MMHIAKNSVVAIRYTMANSRGEVLETIMNNDPVIYLQGDKGIHPLLQAQLEGLKAGDMKQVHLSVPSGLNKEDFIFEVVVDEVRAALNEEIMLGYPLNRQAAHCGAGCDCNK